MRVCLVKCLWPNKYSGDIIVLIEEPSRMGAGGGEVISVLLGSASFRSDT